MNRNKLTFESENFQIHYLTLNLQFDDLKRIKNCCNSVLIDGNNLTQVNSQKYWSGTSLSFSGILENY